jgi:hypothetical protein
VIAFAISTIPRTQLCGRMVRIIDKFNCVCIFLFQYIDNDETLEKLCWTQNVFHLCQVQNIFGMRTREFCSR